MKTLPANATTEKNKSSNSPINFLKIELDSGDVYYSDRAFSIGVISISEKVIDWGNITEDIQNESGETEIFSYSIVLKDENKTLLSTNLQAKKVSLYQWWTSLSNISDAVLLGTGYIRGKKWKESDATITIEILESLDYYNREIGLVADETKFANISKDQKNSTIPTIFGKVTRTPSVLVYTGAETNLSINLIPLAYQNDEDFHITVVDDSRDFEQETELDLWINTELVTGIFKGRQLFLTERERTIITIQATGNSTASNNFVSSELIPEGAYWLGLTAKITNPPSSFPNLPDYSYRGIVVYQPNATYYLDQVNNWFEDYKILTSTYIDIYGAGGGKPAGTRVREKKDYYLFALCTNDIDIDDIELIEIKGETYQDWERFSQNNPVTGQPTGRPGRGLPTLVQLEKVNYSVSQLSITDSPTGLVSCAKLTWLPTWNSQSEYTEDVLYATLTGYTAYSNYAGNDYNPAGLLKRYCVEILGMSPAEIDSTSYDDAVEKSEWMKVGFAITNIAKGLDILYDLAFQYRIKLTWNNGKLYFHYLENKIDASVSVTISDSDRVLDSVEIEDESSEEIITRVIVKWFDLDGEQKTKELINTSAEETYQKKVKELDFWGHNQEAYAISVAQFYLNRWSKLYKKIKFKTFLNKMELERNDWVSLNFSGITTKNCEIQSINKIFGNGINNTIDEYEIEGLIPELSDDSCTGNCELYCEADCTTGCELYTMIEDCDYSCESNNQDTCNLACVSYCQMNAVTCKTLCQQACQTDSQLDCDGGCEVTGTEDDNTCDTSCEYGNTTCTDTCEITCETGCEVTCQTDCELFCEFACEQICELVCQIGCEVSVEP